MSSSAANSSGNGSTTLIRPLSRFCDYFVICGLDYSSGLEVLQTYEVDGSSKFKPCDIYLILA